MDSKTRSKTEIWLIGQPESRLPDRVLPNTEQVLQTLYHHHATNSVFQSLKLTTDELLSIWACARIPTALHQNITCKLRSLVNEYNLLKKNKSRQSSAQRSREEEFKIKMKLLFDISHKDTETLMNIEEDKIFLKDQQGVRKMVMAGVDKQLTQQEERTAQRRLTEQLRKEKEEQRKAQENLTVSESRGRNSNIFSSSDADDKNDSDESGDSEIEFEIPTSYYKQKLTLTSSNFKGEADKMVAEAKRSKLLENTLSSPDVASALDRINLSDRKFTMLAAAIAKANGDDLSKMTLSRQTVRRKRSAHRLHIDSCIRYEFQSNNDKPSLVCHWMAK